MKIAIFSDTHDNWQRIKEACQLAKQNGAKLLIHCGDICAPITLDYLAKLWSNDIHYVLGNVDGDPFLMLKNNLKNKKIHHHGAVLGELQIDKRYIAFQHYPELAQGLASSGKYDAVFYGHTHIKNQSIVGKTLLVNPGNLCDIKNPPSFAIYETKTNTIEFINLKK